MIIVVKIILLFFLTILCVSLYEEIQEYHIVQTNHKIAAEIIAMPDCCDCKVRWARFKYKTIYFNQKVLISFCEEYKVGDYYVFYHSEEDSEYFIPEHEAADSLVNFDVLSIFLGMIAVVGVFMYISKLNKA